MGNIVIENYEPEDDGWAIVLGPFIRPEPKDIVEAADVPPPDEDES